MICFFGYDPGFDPEPSH